MKHPINIIANGSPKLSQPLTQSKLSKMGYGRDKQHDRHEQEPDEQDEALFKELMSKPKLAPSGENKLDRPSLPTPAKRQKKQEDKHDELLDDVKAMCLQAPTLNTPKLPDKVEISAPEVYAPQAVKAVISKMVERIRVSAPGLNAADTIDIKLHDSQLAGAEIRLQRNHGEIFVTISLPALGDSPSSYALKDKLDANLEQLQTSLTQQLNEPVTARVVTRKSRDSKINLKNKAESHARGKDDSSGNRLIKGI